MKLLTKDLLVEAIVKTDFQDFPDIDKQEFLEFILRYEKLAEIWENCQRPDWMLWILRETDYRNDRQLRLFTVDGARQCECFNTKAAAELTAIAFRFACGEASSHEMEKVREKYGNLALTASWLGMKHGRIGASRLLAVYETTHPDAFKAAILAVRYAFSQAEGYEQEVLTKALADKLKDLVEIIEQMRLEISAYGNFARTQKNSDRRQIIGKR